MSKRLFRSRQSRMIGGVCGGLAEYFDVDPVIVRALFVITTFGYGIGFIAYIVFWIIVPERQKVYLDDSKEVFKESASEETILEEIDDAKSNDKRKLMFGAILVVLGILFLLKNILPSMDWGYIWPLVLILIGGSILYNSYKKNNSGGIVDEI